VCALRTKNEAESKCMRIHRIVFGAIVSLWIAAGLSWGEDKSIVIASTTSTKDSGLFGYILPMFEAETGMNVKVVAVGTGKALDIGRHGGADVIFAHAAAQEEQFVAEGFGVKRFDVMYNDFVLIGPKADPAKDDAPKLGDPLPPA
jgi:tungstate transport system substrate-binding protein